MPLPDPSRPGPTRAPIDDDSGDEAVPLHWIKAASIAEGTSLLLLLLVAVPLKHLAGWPNAVQVMGPLHGLLLSAYLCMLVPTLSSGRWRRADAARLLLLPLLPLGGYFSAALLGRGKAARSQAPSARGHDQ